MDVLHPTVAPGRATGLLTTDIVVIVATGLLLALGLVVWAKYFWKGSRHKRSHHHRHERAVDKSQERSSDEGSAEEGADEEGEASGGHRHRRRRRRVTRRDHRQRNPSLAETGGLPPKREEGVPPPAGI